MPSARAAMTQLALREWARRLKRDVLTAYFAARHAGTPLLV